MLIQSDSRKPERAMSDCQGQLPLREQQAKVSNFVKFIKIVSYKLFHFPLMLWYVEEMISDE